MTADAIKLLLFPAIMAFAATSDLLTMTISNRISLLLAGGFFVLAIIIGMRGTEILMHISAGAVILIASFICFANGWIGGGDAKLAAATALWFGFSHLLDYLMIASLFGGALTLLLIQARKVPLPSFLVRQEWARRLHDKNTGIPYGVALAAAGLLIYPETIWMKAIAM